MRTSLTLFFYVRISFLSSEVQNCFQNEIKITYNKDEIGFQTHLLLNISYQFVQIKTEEIKHEYLTSKAQDP